MTEWRKFGPMLGKTPYSDWRVKADVEVYFRGANFHRDKLARAIRFINEGSKLRGIGPFLDILGERADVFAVSEHFRHIETGSGVLYAGPSSAVDKALLRASDDVAFEFGPLVDKAILRPSEFGQIIQPSFTEPWCENDVICAIIDDTIGFANARFRKEQTKTRIEALWIMDGTNGPCISPEYGVFGGLVLFRDQIDCLLDQFHSDGAVDEAALYRHLDDQHDIGLSHLQSVTHGTHVLDLFAGAEMGECPDDKGARPIIAVVLPQVAVRDSSGTHSEFFVQEAVAWINKLAEDFKTKDSQQVPLVSNFSFGLLAGPHDGHSLLEKSLATIPARSNSAAVVPAGNSFGSRTHAVAEICPENKSFTVGMTISPHNRLSTFVEIWRPEAAGIADPLLKLTIRTPQGDPLTEFNPEFGGGFEWCPAGNLTLRSYHLLVPRDEGCSTKRELAMIAILPTDAQDSALPLAPEGDWTISFEYPDNVSEDVQLWIQRGGSVFGHPLLGRQSRFAEGQVCVQDEGTLNALATAVGVVAVGGYVGSEDFPPAPYTSAGSARFQMELPDVSAPSGTNRSTPGIVASGTFSGSYASLSGTSVAAPRVARLLADEADGFGSGPKAFLHALAMKRDPDNVLRRRLGVGRLFLPVQ